jgi:serine/threonine-protein kinase
VAGIFDYGEDPEHGIQFIVMELIDGETLSAKLQREGALPPAEAAGIAASVADALQAAHEAGVVHRDVKPGNVMVTPKGDVKVMDFGIAAAAWAAPITAKGSAMGTATYISPEQAAGERATAASDVYSLGVVLYEMLAGRPPFTGQAPVAVAAAHVHDDPPLLSEAAPNVPDDLAAACQRALAKDPAARPPTAAAFSEMLRRSVGTGPAPAPWTEPARIGEGSAESERTSVLRPATGTQVLPAATAAPTHPVGADMAPGPPRPRRPIPGWFWLVGAVIVLVLIAVAISSIEGGDVTPTPTSTPPGSTPSGPRGPSVSVPSLVGMKLDEAKAALSAADLTPGPVKFVQDSPPGIVVRTDPPAGTSVSPGVSVTLYVGAKRHDHGGDNGKGKGNND